MNLNALIAPYISAINPNLLITIYPSHGSTVSADGTRTPAYGEPYEAIGSVQALGYTDIMALQGMQLTGIRKAIYLSAPLDGIVRPEQKGGDLIAIPDAFDEFGRGSLWLVAYVLEPWYSTGGWNKVAATLQVDQIPPQAATSTVFNIQPPQIIGGNVSGDPFQWINLNNLTSYPLTAGTRVGQTVGILDNLRLSGQTITGSFNIGNTVTISEPGQAILFIWNGSLWIIPPIVGSQAQAPASGGVISVTASRSITASQSGTTFDNYGAIQTVQLMLPPWQSALTYTFIVGAPQALVIIPNGSDQISGNGQLFTSLSSAQLYACLVLSTSDLPGIWISRSLTGEWSG